LEWSRERSPSPLSFRSPPNDRSSVIPRYVCCSGVAAKLFFPRVLRLFASSHRSLISNFDFDALLDPPGFSLFTGHPWVPGREGRSPFDPPHQHPTLPKTIVVSPLVRVTDPGSPSLYPPPTFTAEYSGHEEPSLRKLCANLTFSLFSPPPTLCLRRSCFLSQRPSVRSELPWPCVGPPRHN